jgi:cytochrome b561
MANDRYSPVARGLHWAAALAILGLVGTGFAAANATDAAGKAALLRLHLPLGLLALALTLLRLLVWRRDTRAGRRPGPPPGTPGWQRGAARAVHLLLLALSLGMVASGIGMVALTGAAPAIFGGGLLPDFEAVLPRIPHGIGARLLALLVILHVAAALHHALIRHDGTLARMGLGRLQPRETGR